MAPQCHSLKEKRSVVRKLKDRAAAKFRVSVHEVGGLDSWQRIVLGFAVSGSNREIADSTASAIVDFVVDAGLARMVECERDTTIYGDEPFGRRQRGDVSEHGDDAENGDAVDTSWLPASWIETSQGEPSGEGGDKP